MIKSYRFKDEQEYQHWMGDFYNALSNDPRKLEEMVLMSNVRLHGGPNNEYVGTLGIHHVLDCAVIDEHDIALRGNPPKRNSPTVTLIGEKAAIEKLVNEYFPAITTVRPVEVVNENVGD